MSTIPGKMKLNVPEGFTNPSATYRFQAWLAMLGLVFFLALYVSLASWFTYTAYRMIAGVFAGGEGAVAGFFAALPAAFLAIFMWKALFFIRSGSDSPGIEIQPAEEPDLFQFLHSLADEIGAPRPYRVFVSPNVNAAVFYDLSILNFIIPSKKNLVIGLGLVNVTNRSEFHAILAHEFGHFAQRTMAVSKWVYVGEQIAAHIIAKRDFLDRTLDFISAIDLRIAWIGWIMRTVVWSIRSLMENVFRMVIIAQRALSREMEFQADRVAVSVTGSDALVHGLYRLQHADEDWDGAIDFANQQLGKGKRIPDLYSIQSRIGEHMRRILSDPTRGSAPEVPISGAAVHRIFSEQIAQPPKMWSTHPPNTEREENAKQIYVPAPLDEEPAWTLFQDPHQLQRRVSDFVFADVQVEKPPEIISDSESLESLDASYMNEYFNPDYQGTYLGRMVTICQSEVSALYAEEHPPRERIAEVLSGLYSPKLQEDVTQLRTLYEEIGMLRAIEAGVADASGGVIKHRGETVPRRQLAQLIERVEQERDSILKQLEDHDQECRTAHLAAARYVAHGWQDYLESVTKLLHYAEHSQNDLSDAYSHLANLTSIATAAGSVSEKNVKKILSSANDLQRIMARFEREKTQVELPSAVAKALEVEHWSEALDELKLPPAVRENIGEWLPVLDSWVVPIQIAFGRLIEHTLDELLKTEKRIASMYLQQAEVTAAPKPATLQDGYPTRARGSERKQETKLGWWAKFTLASGWGPSIARLTVASSIVAAVVLAGAYVGNATIIVFNGLATAVTVEANSKTVTVGPLQQQKFSMGASRKGEITTRTQDGRLIETFEENLDKGFATYVYNVSGASPMVEWTVTYGNAIPRPPNFLGAPRWRSTSAYYILREPPKQIEIEGEGARRLVLSSEVDTDPRFILGMIEDKLELDRMVWAHATFDPPDSRNILFWLGIAEEMLDYPALLQTRLQHDPGDLMALRAEQDLAAKGEENDAVRARHRAAAENHPDDPDWQYIATRATPDGPEQDAAFIKQLQRWPDHVWFNYASSSVYCGRAEWDKALQCLTRIYQQRGAMTDPAAMQAARIHRLQSPDGKVNLSNLTQISPSLQNSIDFETGEGLENSPLYAYRLMHEGRLDAAFQRAGGGSIENDLLILLAASKGAKREWQDSVFDVNAEEWGFDELLFVAALAARHELDYENYLQISERKSEADVSPIPFLQKVFQGAAPADCESDLEGLFLHHRAYAFAAATVFLGEETPAEWRRQAERLLFAFERPFF